MVSTITQKSLLIISCCIIVISCVVPSFSTMALGVDHDDSSVFSSADLIVRMVQYFVILMIG